MQAVYSDIVQHLIHSIFYPKSPHKQV